MNVIKISNNLANLDKFLTKLNGKTARAVTFRFSSKITNLNNLITQLNYTISQHTSTISQLAAKLDLSENLMFKIGRLISENSNLELPPDKVIQYILENPHALFFESNFISFSTLSRNPTPTPRRIRQWLLLGYEDEVPNKIEFATFFETVTSTSSPSSNTPPRTVQEPPIVPDSFSLVIPPKALGLVKVPEMETQESVQTRETIVQVSEDVRNLLRESLSLPLPPSLPVTPINLIRRTYLKSSVAPSKPLPPHLPHNPIKGESGDAPLTFDFFPLIPQSTVEPHTDVLVLTHDPHDNMWYDPSEESVFTPNQPITYASLKAKFGRSSSVLSNPPTSPVSPSSFSNRQASRREDRMKDKQKKEKA